MNNLNPRTPVIVGVGEITQRTKLPNEALEPLALMEAALRAAEHDARAPLLAHLDSLDVIQEFSWPYLDAPRQLSERLGIAPRRCHYGPVGGETPIYFLHEAALRIWRGESELAAVVGAEAQYAATAAQKQGHALPWSPQHAHAKLRRGADYLHRVAVQLGVASPATVYPFYENAAQHAWGQTPQEGRDESGQIWARCSEVASSNANAWSRHALKAEDIVVPGEGNRLVAWPYTVRMVANPLVNQGAATLVTSLGRALELGIAPERLVYLWFGAAAQEPDDYLERDQYARVPAQEAVLERILEQVGDRGGFAAHELYSCFPIVPKMARRTLALPASATLTTTGGLSFFGAPLNNYMSHATAAMVQSLRERPRAWGLLYGQGGYLTKHHAIVLASAPPDEALLNDDYSVQATADSRRGAVPALALEHTGTASMESHTVVYQRDATPLHGVVIARTPQGQRLLAKLPAGDVRGIAALTDLRSNPIGQRGRVTRDAGGMQIWSFEP